MSLHIEYLDAPDGVQDTMRVTPLYLNEEISDTSKTEGVEDIPFATLEPGVWKLDGTRQLLSGEKEVFLWGDEPGGMIYVLISPNETTSLSGITLHFSESTSQWPSKVNIKWTFSDRDAKSVDYTPTSAVLVAEEDAVNLTRIGMSIYPKTNERVKIRKITLGREYSFGKGELENVNVVSESDPSLLTVTADTLSFDVIVKDGMSLSPMEGHQVTLFKNGVQECVQFVKDFERIRKNSYHIVCQSLIGKMEDTYYGRVYIDQYDPDYANDGRRTPGSLAAEIAPNCHIDISGLPTGVALYGHLETQPQRDALCQLAFLVGRTVNSKDGVIGFKQLPSSVSSYFGNNRILKTHRVKQIAEYTAVRFPLYAWKRRGYTSGHPVIASGTFAPGDMIETDRYWGTLTDGDRALDVYAAHEVGIDWIRMLEAYSGDICGGSSYDIIKNSADWVISTTGKQNVLSVEKLTLDGTQFNTVDGQIVYGDNIIGSVFYRLESFAKLNLLVEQDVIVTTQQAGDYVRTVTPWGEIVEGYIISMDSKLTQNGHTARIKILGKKVS